MTQEEFEVMFHGDPQPCKWVVIDGRTQLVDLEYDGRVVDSLTELQARIMEKIKERHA